MVKYAAQKTIIEVLQYFTDRMRFYDLDMKIEMRTLNDVFTEMKSVSSGNIFHMGYKAMIIQDLFPLELSS